MCAGGASLADGDFEDFGLIVEEVMKTMKIGIDCKDDWTGGFGSRDNQVSWMHGEVRELGRPLEFRWWRSGIVIPHGGD